MASGSANTSAVEALDRRLSTFSIAVLPSRLATTDLKAFQKWISVNLPPMNFLLMPSGMRLVHSSHTSPYTPLAFFATALLKMALMVASVRAPPRSL